MQCKDVDEALLAEHLLGGLDPSREKELETHLSECRRCAAERERTRALLAKVRKLGGRRTAPDRPERVGEIMAALDRTPPRLRLVPANGTTRGNPTSWVWAAAAALLMAVTVFALARPSQPVLAPAPRAQAPAAEPEVARAVPEPASERPIPPEPKPETPVPKPEKPPGTVEPKPPSASVEPKPVLPAPEPKPAEAAREPEKPPPPKDTIVFAAALEQVRGEVFLVSPDGSRKATDGDGLAPGYGLETRGSPSGAFLRYPDGTQLELGPDTVVRDVHDLEPKAARGKRVTLARGSLIADVVKQPAGRFMSVATPHAETTVLGTTFRLVAEPASTRLEVKEGRVRFGRPSGKPPVEVKTGQYAVAGANAEPVAKGLAHAEILLLPQNGHIAGKVWQLVKDPEAVAEQAFEALRAPSRGEQFAQGLPRAPRVSFAFQADPEITYYVWMRGRGTAGNPPQDAVIVEVPGALFTGQPAMDKERLGGSAERALFEGFGQKPGYAWIGGDEQDGKHELPVRLRFSRPGLQTLTLHADETPVRIDAIWISATQSVRPGENQKGPWTARK